MAGEAQRDVPRRAGRAARQDRALSGGRPRRDASAGGGDPGSDDAFPYFARAQADRLRALVAEEFGRAGVTVDVRGGVATDGDGRVFGLAALGGACLDASTAPGGEATWPALVVRHVRVALAADAAPPVAALPEADVLARTVLRLVGRSTLPEAALGRYRYGRALGGDLVELLALSPTDPRCAVDPGAPGGSGVRILDDGEVAAFPPGVLRTAGMGNLLLVRGGTVEVLRGGHGQEVWSLTGPSPFTASLLLALPEVLHRVAAPPAPDGLLVAVPYRHQLAFTPVRAATVLADLELLVPLAARGFADGVGAVSPFVYWWRDGSLTQVSVLTARGTWAVDDVGPFGVLLDRLLADPGGPA